MGASASRQKFTTAVTALVTTDVSPDDDAFWDALWKIDTSAEEIFELISANSARRLRDEQFDNLCLLVTQATAQLCQIVKTPSPDYFDQILNCVRVLTRLVPILLEREDLEEVDDNVELFCWGVPEGSNNAAGPEDAILGLTIGPASSRDKPKQQQKQQDVKIDESEPIAVMLIHAAMQMLFLRDFAMQDDVAYNDEDDDDDDDEDDAAATQDENSRIKFSLKPRVKEAKDFQLLKKAVGMTIHVIDGGASIFPTPVSKIWTVGVAIKAGTDDASAAKFDDYDLSRRQYDKRRLEVLRLLLAACSGPIYCTIEEYNPCASRWLSLMTATNTPNVNCLFYSLVNTIFNFDPAAYQSIIYNKSTEFLQDHVRLVETSAQLLAVLLDWGIAGSPRQIYSKVGEPVVDYEKENEEGFNIHRTLLARMESSADLKFVFDGFARLLKNSYESNMPFFTSSTAKLRCFKELVVLLWKFIEENPLFMPFILEKCDINQIVVPICYLMNEARKDPSQSGLIHLCTFLFLKLSGERAFGTALRQPCKVSLPSNLPVCSGGHTDLIAVTMYNLMADGNHKLEQLYTGFLTVIRNISPYWRFISIEAATRMVELFNILSNPKLLYCEDDTGRDLGVLLQIYNNVIHYQYHSNTPLVYAIVKWKICFQRVASMTLESIERECKISSANNETKTSKNETSGGAFQPTQQWLDELQESLPIESVIMLIEHTQPLIDKIVQQHQLPGSTMEDEQIVAILQTKTLVGLLPVPPTIIIEKFQPNKYTFVWITAFLWGVVFLRNQHLPLFDGKCVELFTVNMTAVANEEDNDDDDDE